MSTRSFIFLELTKEEKKQLNTNKNLVGVYCHYDGYITGGNGELLAKHYKSRKKILSLIKKGDLRYIERNLKDCDWFNPKGSKEAKESVLFINKKELAKQPLEMICYVYIYTKNNKWVVRYSNTRGRFIKDFDLEEEIKKLKH